MVDSATPAAYPSGTIVVSVVKGRVTVSNKYGRQVMLANQWTHVKPGKAPSPPTAHDATADVGWTATLPPP